MPRTGRGGCHSQSFRTGYHLKTRNRHPPAVAAEAPAARPYVHGLLFSRSLFSSCQHSVADHSAEAAVAPERSAVVHSQHLHGARGLNKNFSDVTGDTVIFPATGTELPLDVDLRALAQIFTCHFRELAEQHHAMPFRLLPHLPVCLSRQLSDVATCRFATAPRLGCNGLPDLFPDDRQE
ncbi:Uncharacterised protein [Escherichia coli]|nr:Uncharacterised protein [Escherichia coli]